MKKMVELLITEDVGNFVFRAGHISEDKADNNITCAPFASVEYTGDYFYDSKDVVHVSVSEFVEELNDTTFQQMFECLNETSELEEKQFKGNAYFYTESEGTSTSRDGSGEYVTTEYMDIHYIWYSENKLIYFVVKDDYSIRGRELLEDYFEKYPSFYLSSVPNEGEGGDSGSGSASNVTSTVTYEGVLDMLNSCNLRVMVNGGGDIGEEDSGKTCDELCAEHGEKCITASFRDHIGDPPDHYGDYTDNRIVEASPLPCSAGFRYIPYARYEAGIARFHDCLCCSAP